MASRSQVTLCAVLLCCPSRAVDDKFMGNAPAALKLPAGPHSILLKFPGHAEWRRTLEILKSSKTSLKAALDPIS
jgi:PEGA domain